VNARQNPGSWGLSSSALPGTQTANIFLAQSFAGDVGFAAQLGADAPHDLGHLQRRERKGMDSAQNGEVGVFDDPTEQGIARDEQPRGAGLPHDARRAAQEIHDGHLGSRLDAGHLPDPEPRLLLGGQPLAFIGSQRAIRLAKEPPYDGLAFDVEAVDRPGYRELQRTDRGNCSLP
jgi:hypothetical protein